MMTEGTIGLNLTKAPRYVLILIGIYSIICIKMTGGTKWRLETKMTPTIKWYLGPQTNMEEHLMMST